MRLAAILFLTTAPAFGQIVRPFEQEAPAGPATQIDGIVLAALGARGIAPANPASDEVFFRRVYLDVIGTLPSPQEVRQFLEDRGPEKRRAVIDSLLAREEFADYWALKWGDLLRIKSEFPINLWPNAVQCYHGWVRGAIRENMPYDRFARELLTSSGSNFRVPPVNFYRAIQGREPGAIARAVALTFLGVRLEAWPPERRAGFEALFSRIAFKATAEWKEEIVLLDPAPAGPLEAVLPDGARVVVPAGEDPRRAFADWLVSAENPYFARCAVNRVWFWLMGRGIVHEPDDVRPDNPPAIPELLDYLAGQLVESGWDLRRVYRLILGSRTYQQSSIRRSEDPAAEALFAFYPVRRLDAEVLLDAINWITGSGETYYSAVPEPYTFLPDAQRAISLADGSISNTFLEKFGRPPRDTGLQSERNNEPSDAQELHLLNSSHVQAKIEKSARLKALLATSKGDDRLLVRTGYLGILSRWPTEEELQTAVDYLHTKGLDRRQAAADLVWALINSKEFLCRH